MRAIVIGAGIGGLSCAIGLRKVGIDVAVYERASELREVGAGIMLWANALRALEALGAWDAVRRISMPTASVQLAARNGHLVQMSALAPDMEAQVGFSPIVCLTHRAELVDTLFKLLPSGTAHFGHECIGIEERGSKVSARFANGHTDEADLLIGADGIRSRVRDVIVGHTEPRYAGYTCWRGVAPRPASLKEGESRLWTGYGSQVGFNPLTNDRVYWFATKNAPAGERSGNEHESVLRTFADWAPPLPELITSTPADRVIRGDIFDRPPARPWTKGRCVLVGDAAHATTPNFGQGGGMAIEDAVVLARCLANQPTDPLIALRSFEDERFSRTSSIIREAWTFGKILQWEGPVRTWLRDTLSGLLMRVTGTSNLIKHARFDVGEIRGTRN